MPRVLVAAASAIVRTGLEALLRQSGLEVAGTSAAGSSLQSDVETLQPDAVLLQVSGADSLPDWHGPALIVLADDLAGRGVTDLLRAGARAVLPGESTPAEIIAAVHAAAAGLVVLHPHTVGTVLPAPPPVARALPASTPALTPREIEVLNMLSEGVGNKTIAWRLGISEHTVKFHISSIFTKLNVQSRTEAVTLGARLGYIML